MCNIWQDKDSPFLSVDQVEYIFSRNDFSFVRSLSLTGGEPTLRSDLPDLFEIVGANCPNLEYVQLATNGLTPLHILEQVRRMLTFVEARLEHVYRFDVQISLDAIGEIHDTIRGVSGSFQRAVKTLDLLTELQSDFSRLGLYLSAVVMPYNLPYLNTLQEMAVQRGLRLQFSPVVLSSEYYSNLQDQGDLIFSSERNTQAVEFFSRLARQEQSSLRYYYRDVSRMLGGAPRGRRCMMGFYSFVLEHDGSVYPCINCEKRSFGNLLHRSFKEIWFGSQAADVRRRLRQDCCPTCTSLCYPLPVNLLEVVDLGWRQIIMPCLKRWLGRKNTVHR
jgi:MoaA/NifB/PqqE/SkfB family radical SAM enzyme